MPSIADSLLADLQGTSIQNDLNGVATGTGNGTQMAGGTLARSATLVIKGSAGISAGAVVLEGSLDNINWFQLIAPVNAVASSVAVGYTGANNGPFRYARSRISTNIVGGTISTDIQLASD